MACGGPHRRPPDPQPPNSQPIPHISPNSHPLLRKNSLVESWRTIYCLTERLQLSTPCSLLCSFLPSCGGIRPIFSLALSSGPLRCPSVFSCPQSASRLSCQGHSKRAVLRLLSVPPLLCPVPRAGLRLPARYCYVTKVVHQPASPLQTAAPPDAETTADRHALVNIRIVPLAGDFDWAYNSSVWCVSFVIPTAVVERFIYPAG